MLLDALSTLSADPLAWGAVALLGAFATHALRRWRACPLLRHRHGLDRAEAAAAIDRPRVDGPRYLLLMLGGIVATVTGLTFLARGIHPAIAFHLLVAGVFVIQTEPARREIRQSELRVHAAELLDADAREAALARLRSAHQWLIALHFLLLGGAVAGLMAF